MPEYLAPGVYVEETSFRAKSIEGVSTSTTGFVGPTRRGPVSPIDPNKMPEIPELLTSFGDFQRIYGGFDDLDYGTNFIAHGVRAYFENGGARLYVARVMDPGAATAQSSNLASGGANVQFVARAPGRAGNGVILVVPHFTDATKRSMERAGPGSLVRVGGKRPALGAQLRGNRLGPWTLPRDGRLLIRLAGTGANNTPDGGAELTLAGSPAEASAQSDMPEPVDLQAVDEAGRTLSFTIDGVAQSVVLPASNGQGRGLIVALLNQGLVGGYARREGDRLIIGSDVQGTASRVAVAFTGVAAQLGFTGAVESSGGGDLPNVRRVTAEELNRRLATFQGGELLAASDPDGNLVISTRTRGADARVTLLAPANEARLVSSLLGFAAGEVGAVGSAGAAVSFFFKREQAWVPESGVGDELALGAKDDAPPNENGTEFVTVSLLATDADGITKSYDELSIVPFHPRYLGQALAEQPSRRADQLENVFAFRATANVQQIRQALLTNAGLPNVGSAEPSLRRVELREGTDGAPPDHVAYEAGLRQLALVEGISIVAAPGESRYPDHPTIQGLLISHCERRRAYRIAVLDTAPGGVVSDAQGERARIDSTYAALYYPWVIVSNPLARAGDDRIPREIALPPSGFVCGIYARNDATRGVFKAPANEVVRGGLRYQADVSFAQQEVLNPAGVNCLRFFPGRGNRVWGARTTSSDAEWKYVNVRRYFNYIERSIDVGTQFAVFEPNGERLWANIRETISSFMMNEWRSGALLGAGPKEAYFVRCDRSTMDQNDLDNGRLICLIGMAVVKPAEFVIFRIGQKTADARS